jgi:hypothetical protein
MYPYQPSLQSHEHHKNNMSSQRSPKNLAIAKLVKQRIANHDLKTIISKLIKNAFCCEYCQLPLQPRTSPLSQQAYVCDDGRIIHYQCRHAHIDSFDHPRRNQRTRLPISTNEAMRDYHHSALPQKRDLKTFDSWCDAKDVAKYTYHGEGMLRPFVRGLLHDVIIEETIHRMYNPPYICACVRTDLSNGLWSESTPLSDEFHRLIQHRNDLAVRHVLNVPALRFLSMFQRYM